MNDFWIGFIIAILIYSLLITLATIYMDNSGYYILGDLNIIIAGPVLWIYSLLLIIFRMPLKKIYNKWHNRKKEYKKKDNKYIEKIVLKIIKNYKKKNYDDYFDFNKMTDDPYCCYSGWESLLIKKEKNESLNKKFSRLMSNQKEDVINILNKYSVVANEALMIKENRDEYYIQQYKDKGLRAIR